MLLLLLLAPHTKDIISMALHSTLSLADSLCVYQPYRSNSKAPVIVPAMHSTTGMRASFNLTLLGMDRKEECDKLTQSFA